MDFRFKEGLGGYPMKTPQLRNTMNTEDIFKTMCAISTAHANLIRDAKVIWANDDEDSFITAEKKSELAQSDPGDQRFAERHSNPLIALTLQPDA